MPNTFFSLYFVCILMYWGSALLNFRVSSSIPYSIKGYWNTLGHSAGVYVRIAVGTNHCLDLLLDSNPCHLGLSPHHGHCWRPEDQSPYWTCCWLQEGSGKCWKGASFRIMVCWGSCHGFGYIMVHFSIALKLHLHVL